MNEPKLIVVEHRHDQPVQPGAILHEYGPRIGERHWRVVDAIPKRRYLHCWCIAITDPIEAANADDEHWHLRRHRRW